MYILWPSPSISWTSWLQHCAMGTCHVNGGKFSPFTEIYIQAESVTFPAILFVELYSKAYMFKGHTI
jgi:hypothetical protein